MCLTYYIIKSWVRKTTLHDNVFRQKKLEWKRVKRWNDNHRERHNNIHDTEIRIQRAYTEPYPYASHKLNVLNRKSLKLSYRFFLCARGTYRVLSNGNRQIFREKISLSKTSAEWNIAWPLYINQLSPTVSRILQQYCILL